MERLRKLDESLPELCQTLTDRTVKFCQQYALTHNGVQSARVAGFALDASLSYPRTLLQDTRVQTAIAYYEAVYSAKTAYSVDKVIAQWSTMASFDLLGCLDNDYELKPLDQLTDDQRKALGVALTGVEVKVNKYGRTVKAELGKVEALKELGKLLKAYQEEKEAGEGLQLTINVGQQVVIDAEKGEAVGHLRISTDGQREG